MILASIYIAASIIAANAHTAEITPAPQCICITIPYDADVDPRVCITRSEHATWAATPDDPACHISRGIPCTYYKHDYG
jgi:hypothetical protein